MDKEINIKNFKKGKRINKRGCCPVYKVEEQKTGKIYAAKVIDCKDDEDLCNNIIENEIVPIINTKHPAINKYIGYSKLDFYDEYNVTIFMKYAKNGSLGDIIKNIQSKNIVDDYSNTTRQIILIGICSGMNYLHNNGIIHRNLKSDNILLDGHFRPLITDFGLLKFKEIGHSYVQSQFGSTIQYQAPEILKNQRILSNMKSADSPYDEKSVDVYAFGIIMYEILTNSFAYPELEYGDITDLDFKFKVVNEKYRPNLDGINNKSIKELINMCLSDNPSERPTFDNLFLQLSTTSYYIDDVDSQEVQNYINEINGSTGMTIQITEKITKIEEEKEQMKNEIINLQNSNKQKDVEISELKESKDQTINELNIQIGKKSRLDSENKRMKTEISTLKKEISKKLKERDQIISQNNLEISKKWKKEKDQINSQKDKEISELKRAKDEEIKELNIQINNIQNEKSSLYTENKRMKTDYLKLQQDYLKLKKEISRNSNQSKEINSYQANYRNILSEYQRQKSKISEYKKEIDKLKQENDRLKIERNNNNNFGYFFFRSTNNSLQLNENFLIRDFNSLPLNLQKTVCQQLKVNNVFFSKIERLISLILNVKPNSNASIEIGGNEYESLRRVYNERRILTNFLATEILFNFKLFESSEFHSILNEFSEFCFGLKYPSDTFESIFGSILKIKKKNITISVFVTELKETDRFFYNNNNVNYIELDETVTEIKGGDEIGAFFGCSNLEKVIISNSIEKFGKKIFCDCIKLQEINLPNSLKKIEENCFSNCSSLKGINIPNSITEINDFVFSNCSNLTQIYLPSSIKSLGNSSFYNCSNLIQISIPSSVQSIGNSCFYNCSNLKQISIPSSVNKIGNNAFDSCTNLNKIDILASLDVLENHVFSSCSSLNYISLPNSLKLIKDGAFYGCKSLIKISIPSNVTKIEDDVFNGCDSLINVSFVENSSLVYIGNSAFADCSALEIVEIPLNVTSVGKFIFLRCSSLNRVVVRSKYLVLNKIYFGLNEDTELVDNDDDDF